jgi:hypothetical protein
LDTEREIQAKRGESADSRAGLILGFSGALAALALNTKTLLALPGALVAVAAAVCAMRVLWPRPQNTVDPVVMRRIFVAAPETDTKKAALDRRVADYEKNKEWINTKNQRLKVSISLLTTAIVLVVGGVGLRLIVDAL